MYHKKLLLCFSILGIVIGEDVCNFRTGYYSCNGLQLNKLKNPRKDRYYSLKIRNSNLPEIPENAFTDFPLILSLDLEHNNIEKVVDGAFNGLPDLGILDLSKNNLTSLSLSAMPKLRHLYLNHNKISKLDLKLHNLETLQMDNNLVTDLSFLDHLPKLEKLYVRGNRLNCVDTQIFQDLRLKTVVHGDNPWRKGCGTAISAWFKERNVNASKKTDMNVEMGPFITIIID